MVSITTHSGLKLEFASNCTINVNTVANDRIIFGNGKTVMFQPPTPDSVIIVHDGWI
jgi:hypothetical protein